MGEGLVEPFGERVGRVANRGAAADTGVDDLIGPLFEAPRA